MYIIVAALLIFLFYNFLFRDNKFSFTFPAILSIGFILRVVIVLLFLDASNNDVDAFRIIGELTLQGKSIYPIPANLRHPYFPFYLYIESFALLFNNYRLQLLLLKLINAVFDIGVIVLLYRISRQNKQIALSYALCPIPILVGAVHGQLDVIPTFFLLLAIFFISNKKYNKSVLFLSFAILVKTWPIILSYSFFKRLIYKLNIVGIFLFPIVSVLAYSIFFKTKINDIVSTITSYHGVYGYWGLGVISNWFFMSVMGRMMYRAVALQEIIFVIALILFVLLYKDKDIVREIFMTLLFVFIISYSITANFFVWIVPFILLVRPKGWKEALVIASVFVSINYIADFPILFRGVEDIYYPVFYITMFIVWVVLLRILYFSIRKDFLRK